MLILLVVLAIIGYLLIPNLFSVRADAVVRGDLIPVTPVYRVRVDKLLVSCASRVRAGQPVANVSNFLLQADYQRQYLQSLEQSQLATVSLDQNVATARQNAEAMHQKYIASSLDQKRVEQDFASYQQAYKAGAIPKVDYDAKRVEVDSARATAQSALSAWQRSEQFVNQISAAQTSKIGSYGKLIDQAQSVANRVGQETLRAPVSGDIVECVERPQNVIEAGTALFSIFQPDRAYVVAYFNPGSIDKLHIGQDADVRITGINHTVRGRVAWVYPNLEALPPELTLFFWQHVQFSQYRPVKIVLDHLPESERQQIYYNAVARVSISTAGHSN